MQRGLFYRTPNHPVAVGLGSILVSDSIGQVERVDPATGKVVSRIDTGRGASGLAVGAGSVWVANTNDGTVSRIDPIGVVIATIRVGNGPTGVAFGHGSIWVAVSLDGMVARIDTATNAVAALVPAGEYPSSVAVGVDAVWIADPRAGRLIEIDPRSNSVRKTIDLGSSPANVPGQQIVLTRNSNYGGERPQGPAEIRYTIGVSRESTLTHVLAGRVDYAGSGPPLAAQHDLLTRFGRGSRSARAGRQQFFVNPVLSSRYVVLNTKRPLFADARLRRAVSYAIDRTALARVWKRFFDAGVLAGGPPTADYPRPACESLRVRCGIPFVPTSPARDRSQGARDGRLSSSRASNRRARSTLRS